MWALTTKLTVKVVPLNTEIFSTYKNGTAIGRHLTFRGSQVIPRGPVSEVLTKGRSLGKGPE